MSLIKKLFGPAAEAVEEIINGVQAGGETRAIAQGPAVQRSPRVRLTPLHRIGFSLKGDSGPIQVSNISVGGMAVLYNGDRRWVKDRVISGIIRIDGVDFHVYAQIRHVSDEVAGCEFVDPQADLRMAIQSYLQVEILALSLRKVDAAFMKPHPRGEALWLTDANQNELYCVQSEGQLVAFHMNFVGNYVEWNSEHQLRVGHVREFAPSEGLGPHSHKGADILDISRAPASEILSLAVVFVENVQQISDDLRKQIQARIR